MDCRKGEGGAEEGGPRVPTSTPLAVPSPWSQERTTPPSPSAPATDRTVEILPTFHVQQDGYRIPIQRQPYHMPTTLPIPKKTKNIRRYYQTASVYCRVCSTHNQIRRKRNPVTSNNNNNNTPTLTPQPATSQHTHQTIKKKTPNYKKKKTNNRENRAQGVCSFLKKKCWHSRATTSRRGLLNPTR